MARLNFLLQLLQLINLLKNSFKETKFEFLEERINKLLKYLWIMAQTTEEKPLQEDVILLSSLHKQASVRGLKHKSFKDSVAEFENVLIGLKKVLFMFYSKNMNLHSTLYLLEDFVDNHSNLFS